MRLIDLVIAVSIALLFFWLLILIALLIRLNSKGPAIFRQDRIGKDGKVFICYKFRSMSINTEQKATHESNTSDVTAIGRYLRAFKLDELPQIWNIFKNEMAFVGPRPCLPSQNHLIDERAKRGVLNSKPGITGWAQIHNIDMSNPVLLAQTDAYYVHNRHIWLDLKIIFWTFIGKGRGDRIG